MDAVSSFIIGLILSVAVIAIVAKLLSWLYMKASGELAFVRTGFGGRRVVRNGGAFVIPVLHQTMPVNLNTLRLEVRRADASSLKTLDRMRVNVTAAFYVHVDSTHEGIAQAAETLGSKTTNPEAVRSLLEGKFIDALRTVAAEMDLRDLHEKRGEFVKRVASRLNEDLLKNGLMLESVSLIDLDQAPREFFDPTNALDAEGLTVLSRQIEDRRRIRNEIERDTELAIQRKGIEVELKQLDLEKEQLAIGRDAEFARLMQKQEVAIRRAQQASEVTREEAEQRRVAEEARISSEQQVQLLEISAQMAIENERIRSDRTIREHIIDTDRGVREKDIVQRKALELVAVEQRTALDIAEQQHAIQVADHAKARAAAEASLAEAEAEASAVREKARISAEAKSERARVEVDEALQARRIEAEKVLRDLEIAKQKAIDLAAIEKQRLIDEAEQDSSIASLKKSVVRLATQAEADAARAAAAIAEQKVSEAAEVTRATTRQRVEEVDSERQRIVARVKAEVEAIRLETVEREYLVNAAGRAALNEAENTLSDAQIALKVKMSSLEKLPDIIRESAKPMQEIDSIKIVQIEGLSSGMGQAGAGDGAAQTKDGAPGNFADQMMTSALRYRTQAPLVDSVLKEVGLDGASLDGLTAPFKFDREGPKLRSVPPAAE